MPRANARACAIARCEEFATVVIPGNGEIWKTWAAQKVPLFVTKAEEVRFDPDNADDLARATAWRAKLPHELINASIKHLNRLEAWSMYFTEGLADHQVAFGPCAPVYCATIVQHYAVLLTIRAESTGKYPNAVKLFLNWVALLEQEKRGLKAGDLLKQLLDLQKQSRGAKDALPKPLGTQVDD